MSDDSQNGKQLYSSENDCGSKKEFAKSLDVLKEPFGQQENPFDHRETPSVLLQIEVHKSFKQPKPLNVSGTGNGIPNMIMDEELNKTVTTDGVHSRA